MRLTVVKKIIIGFAIFWCLLFLVGILSYFGLTEIRRAAVSVVEEKMPLQVQMMDIKSQTLALSTMVANGFHEEDKASLAANQLQFSALQTTYERQLTNLAKARRSVDVPHQGVVEQSRQFIHHAGQMYHALSAKLDYHAALQAQLLQVITLADEASALMLDLSYLDSQQPGIATLIGAGNNIDNKLLTLNTALSELAKTTSKDATLAIIEDLDYQFSNLQVDTEYLNRLAETINTNGTVEAFNQQFSALQEAVNGANGLIALQQSRLNAVAQSQQSRHAATQSLAAALLAINALFETVSQATIDGQQSIVETVQESLTETLLVSAVGLVAACILATMATRSIARPLARINAGLGNVADGDLTISLPDHGNDEFADLAKKVNALIHSLRELIGNIHTQETQLVTISKDSVAMGERSLKDVDKQREQVTRTSSNTQNVQRTSHSNLAQIQQSSAALETITEQSQSITRLVEQSRQQSNEQARQAEQSALAIARLDDNSRSIGSILDVIKTIAEQTNLLALNAAIEAARAGDQGRGFAVVADEVRTLATRTQNSTAEIEGMIDSLQQDAAGAVNAISAGREQAQVGVQIIEQVKQQVAQIADIITQLSQINRQIVTDTQQQDTLLADVVRSLDVIVTLADSSAQSTHKANDSVMQLDARMDSLRAAVERFTL